VNGWVTLSVRRWSAFTWNGFWTTDEACGKPQDDLPQMPVSR